MLNHHQRGVSLVVTFLIMTIMLSIVLSVSIILVSQIKVIRNIGSSVSAFYAAETGNEKTLYFDRKQVPPGGNRGLCNLCNACTSDDCMGCTAVPTGPHGCDTDSCLNCRVIYVSVFDGRSYLVDENVEVKSGSNVFTVNSRGLYKDTARALEISSSD